MDVVMQELFGSSIGLLSLFTIGFIIAMAIFIYLRVMKNIREEERR
ncbi:MAG: DUF3149 domain-containing protein [Thiobacillaceae bacterium]|jgi:hypothetical protein|nr:DUF3149 domain-containing protein [Thiobacillaceae bacterium]